MTLAILHFLKEKVEFCHYAAVILYFLFLLVLRRQYISVYVLLPMGPLLSQNVELDEYGLLVEWKFTRNPEVDD
jgi:hypothetical protein